MNAEDEPAGSGPDRRQLIAIFGGLAALGLVLGAGTAVLTGGDDTAALNGAATETSPGVVPVGSSDDPSASAGPTQTATPTATRKPDYRPIPENAAADTNLDFGFLNRVVSRNGTVTLRFDRATFFTGDAAKQRNGGQTPDNDYLIENINPAQRSFSLDPKASIIVVNRLRTDPEQVGRETLTLDQFVKNANRVLTGSITDLPVWLRHTDGLTGPVTALAEQFLP
jgi:hypothetical protein